MAYRQSRERPTDHLVFSDDGLDADLGGAAGPLHTRLPRPRAIADDIE